MPMFWALIGESIETGHPSNRIVPESGTCSPEKMLISVLFPAPFSPSRKCTSPACKLKSTFFKARTPGNCLQTALASRTVGPVSIVMDLLPFICRTLDFYIVVRFPAFFVVFVQPGYFYCRSRRHRFRFSQAGEQVINNRRIG